MYPSRRKCPSRKQCSRWRAPLRSYAETRRGRRRLAMARAYLEYKRSIDRLRRCVCKCARPRRGRMECRVNFGGASSLSFNGKDFRYQACNDSNWLAPLLLRKRHPSQRSRIRARRIRNEPSYVRRSKSDAEALRDETRTEAAAGARVVSGAFSSDISRRHDAEISAGRRRKYFHSHGHQLLGYGGEHCESWIDQR